MNGEVAEFDAALDSRDVSRIYEKTSLLFGERVNRRLQAIETGGGVINWPLILSLRCIAEIQPGPDGGGIIMHLVDELEHPRTWFRWEACGQEDAAVWDLQLATGRFARRYVERNAPQFAGLPTRLTIDLTGQIGALSVVRGLEIIEVAKLSPAEDRV